MLCMNEAMTPAHLRALLLMCTEDAFVQDVVSDFDIFIHIKIVGKKAYDSVV